MKPNIKLKVTQVAYYWIELGYYGSEDKAIKALLAHKGMENVDPAEIKDHLHKSVEILNHTKDLRSELLSAYEKSSITELTEIEWSSVRSQLESALEKEYPGFDPVMEYLLGMLWDMPFLR